MKASELRVQVRTELEHMALAVREIEQFLEQIGGEEPSVFQKAGAGALMSQFYSGVERVLKRICIYSGVPVPIGQRWHIELFKMFCDPAKEKLAVLLDADLERLLRPYREFRHVFAHGYAVLLDWEEMLMGARSASDTFSRFSRRVEDFLAGLSKD